MTVFTVISLLRIPYIHCIHVYMYGSGQPELLASPSNARLARVSLASDIHKKKGLSITCKLGTAALHARAQLGGGSWRALTWDATAACTPACIGAPCLMNNTRKNVCWFVVAFKRTHTHGHTDVHRHTHTGTPLCIGAPCSMNTM